MRISVVHNRYLFQGGEDGVFNAEVSLLREHGHEVNTWTADNHDVVEKSRLWIAANTIWSRSSYRHLTQFLQEWRPDVVHFHNTFFAISPSAYYACQDLSIPVVQTLHNYRLLCPAATLLREGKICEDCMGNKGFVPSIQHGCWRSSRANTSVVATMLTTHRLLKTWQKQVNRYIVLTEFARQKFIAGGLPAEKMVVKPNFVPATHTEAKQNSSSRRYVLFVGRLSREKGLDLLLEAWKKLPAIPLKIVGDGPLRSELENTARQSGLTQVEFCGSRSQTEVFKFMQEASLLVLPSIWYEGLPLTAIEAFSRHLPVVATGVGAMAEIVQHQKNGINFKLNNVDDLVHWMKWAWEHPNEMSALADKAYQDYQEKYTPEANYQQLMVIYQQAINR